MLTQLKYVVTLTSGTYKLKKVTNYSFNCSIHNVDFKIFECFQTNEEYIVSIEYQLLIVTFSLDEL